MATIVAAAGGGNWNATGTWVGGVVPTASSDVQLTSASGPVTITATAACRSLDCTGYTGTLTHNSGILLSIGDGTAGNLAQALKLVAGMTYTLVNASTAGISFVSTSATQQTIDFGTKITGNLTWAGSGGSWIMSNGMTSTASSWTLTQGSLDTNGKTFSISALNMSTAGVKSLTLGASAFTLAGNVGFLSTNVTFSCGTSSFTLTGTGPTFNGAGFTFNNVTFTGGGMTLIGANTFANLTHTGTTVKTNTQTLQGDQVVTGTYTVTGNSSLNRILINSDQPGTARTITAAAVALSNVDLQDITGAGAASWNLAAITGLSGDCGGNSGITFTTPTTQTHTSTSSFNWSNVAAWTSRVPLPQDDVVAVKSAGTLTADMPRWGKNIDLSGMASAAGILMATTGTAYGSVTLSSTATTTLSTLTLSGRGSHTLTTAGRTMSAIIVTAPGGTYTLGGTLALNTSSGLTLTAGTLNSANFDITCVTFNSTGTLTRSLILGTSTVNLTTTATTSVWNLVATGMTLSAASSTIVLTSVTTNNRTFVGGGQAYGTLTYTVAGSTGSMIITGANTFDTLNVSDASNARTLTLPSTVTTTILSNFNVFGSAAGFLTVNASSAGTKHNLSKASGVVSSVDWVTLTDSNATGGATWYTGANSAGGSNFSGWIASAAPVVTSSPRLLLMGIG